MFEDPELQDPSSQSLTENSSNQTLPHQEPIKAPTSSNFSCETPEIQVIIKEEEEGWSVSENYESLSPERDETSEGTCCPYFKASRKEGCISYGVKIHQRVCPMENSSQESDGHSICGQSSTATEGRQRHVPKGFNEKLKLSCIRGKAPGNVHQCNKTGEKHFPCPECDTSPGNKGDKKSNLRAHEGDECHSQDQSTTSRTEEERQPNLSAPYQTDSPEHYHLTSHGLKMASANLNDQALHLTVRLQAEDREDEEGQDEEIGGLINSDGEVVEWDAKDNSDHGSDYTEGPRSGKGDILSKFQHQGQNQRDSSSPTLLMEVVGDDDETEEGQQKEGVLKMTAISPLRCGKRPRGRKRVPVVYFDNSDTEEDSPAKTAKKRGRRKFSQRPMSSGEDLEADSGVSSRTRRRRNIRTTVEPEELNSKIICQIPAKQRHKRRKKTKPSGGEGENTAVTTGKKRPGRKMVRVPIEIPPELLKTPKEKIEYRCSICGKEFPHAYKLERHELTHTGEKPYCCSICGRGFNQKGNLKTHYKVHLGRKGAIDFDEEANPSASELAEYLKSLPGESRIRSTLRCLECGMDCESHSALEAHHVTAHSEATTESDAVEHSASQFLFCRRCGIRFSEKEKLEEHLKTHIKEKRYPCPDCGKRFINESYIQIHQRIHTGEKPFLCSQCGRGFYTASSLKLHEMQHSGERPFACSVCGKTFRINSYLTAHYQTHIKYRPFICSVCGKGYARSEELKVHYRLHTGERPYECGECGKSFIYRQGLRQHQRTHAGRRIGPTRQLGRPKQRARLDI